MLDTSTQYHVRFLQRLPLGLDYVSQMVHLRDLMTRPPLSLHTPLVLDASGVGLAVAQIADRMGLSPRKVTIVAGDGISGDDGLHFRVAKGLLISKLTSLLHTRQLKIAAELPDAPVLMQELQDFRAKYTASGNLTYNAREGKHDDLVLSVALGVLLATGSFTSHAGLLEYADQQTGNNANSFYVAADLGCQGDFTAICVIERVRVAEPAPERQPLPQGCIITDLSSILL